MHLGEEATLKLFWQGGAIPAKLSQVKLFSSWQSLKLLATMFTSLFLHAGWVHLLGNMLFLWVFGEALEDELGHWRFLGFYFFCGFFSLLIHSVAAGRLSVPIIGASGAIAGLLGAYLIRYPQAPVQTLIYCWCDLKSSKSPPMSGWASGCCCNFMVCARAVRWPGSPIWADFSPASLVSSFLFPRPSPAKTKKASPRKKSRRR